MLSLANLVFDGKTWWRSGPPIAPFRPGWRNRRCERWRRDVEWTERSSVWTQHNVMWAPATLYCMIALYCMILDQSGRLETEQYCESCGMKIDVPSTYKSWSQCFHATKPFRKSALPKRLWSLLWSRTNGPILLRHCCGCVRLQRLRCFADYLSCIAAFVRGVALRYLATPDVVLSSSASLTSWLNAFGHDLDEL